MDLKEGLILAHIWWLVSFQTRRAAVHELFIVSKFLKRTINRIEEFCTFSPNSFRFGRHGVEISILVSAREDGRWGSHFREQK